MTIEHIVVAAEKTAPVPAGIGVATFLGLPISDVVQYLTACWLAVVIAKAVYPAICKGIQNIKEWLKNDTH